MWTWSEHDGAGRPLTAAIWLGSAVMTWTWRFGSKAVATMHGRRQRNVQPRLGRVSVIWLNEYDSESAKHEGQS
jgi:hypothetical protein